MRFTALITFLITLGVPMLLRAQIPALKIPTDVFYSGSKYKPDVKIGASIIKDETTVFIDPNLAEGVQLYTDRKVQMRVTDAIGSKYSKISFNVHTMDSLVSFKGTTLDRTTGSGSSDKLILPVKENDLIRTQINDTTVRYEIEFPLLSFRATISYIYRIKSKKGWRINTWEPSGNLPVRESTLQVVLPESVPVSFQKSFSESVNAKESTELLDQPKELILSNDIFGTPVAQAFELPMKKYKWKIKNVPVNDENNSVRFIFKKSPTSYFQSIFIRSLYTFGSINEYNLAQRYYPKDSTADAYIIFDKGKTHRNGRYERHVRVKILNPEGFKWADFTTPFYNRQESPKVKVEGFTYNLVNGELEKTSLTEESVFDDKVVDNYRTRKRISFPKVKAGSIVELHYEIPYNGFFVLNSWEFQNLIPTLHSEYVVEIPSNWEIHKLFSGHVPLTFYDEEQYFDFDIKVDRYTWAIDSVPALEVEPFIANADNFLSKINFQFIRYGSYDRLDSWETVIKNLYTDFSSWRYSYFGIKTGYEPQSENRRFLKEAVDSIRLLNLDKKGQLIAAYTYIKSKMDWNGEQGIYLSRDLKYSFKDGFGNVTDINMMLIALIEEIGINVHPVILGTRKNGIVNPVYPNIDKYNYMIAYAKIGDNIYFMDATDKNLSFNMLPNKCINGRGRLISKTYSDWIDIPANRKISHTYYAKMTMSQNGTLTGTLNCSNKAYSGYLSRSMLDSISKDAYKDRIQSINKSLEIEQFEITTGDNTQGPVKEVYQLRIEADKIGDKLIFNPIIVGQKNQNPFTSEHRKYPIDLVRPEELNYIFSLSIPENMVFEQLPEPGIVSLPNNAGTFVYNVTKSPTNMQLVVKFKMNRTGFQAEDYVALQEFMEHVVSKSTESVVIKLSK